MSNINRTFTYMNPITLIWFFLAGLGGGSLGYILRIYISKKNFDSYESKIKSLEEKHQTDVKKKLNSAEKKVDNMIDDARKEASNIRQNAILVEKNSLKKEQELEQKIKNLEKDKNELRQKADKVKSLYKEAETFKSKQEESLQKIAGLTKDEAKNILISQEEKLSQKDLMIQIERLESVRKEHLEQKAKNIMVLAMQKYAQEQVSEYTTTTIPLENEEIKGKIIGKEGRNIRTLENSTGVQIIVDDTPETIVLSSFDPIRRTIAKLAVENLLKDGRIQPARIEEFVIKAKEEIHQKIKKAGDSALYELGITGVDSKLAYILGRLMFRTSYGQNVLMHSIEVAYLAGIIASELGANVMIAKMGGLFHDIGKALDHEVEGTHVNIGMMLLSKYNIDPEVIKAMQSHHEEYPYETIESRIVQVADAISASRPGARRDTADNYIKRLGALEKISNSFNGVERSYAINAGREIRIFVTPYKVSDINAKKLARNIANRIEEELNFPGEIKVTVIRETRIIDYAR